MNWLRRLFCAHRYEWMRNIYGDQINEWNARSLWRCDRCGSLVRRQSLHKMRSEQRHG